MNGKNKGTHRGARGSKKTKVQRYHDAATALVEQRQTCHIPASDLAAYAEARGEPLIALQNEQMVKVKVLSSATECALLGRCFKDKAGYLFKVIDEDGRPCTQSDTMLLQKHLGGGVWETEAKGEVLVRAAVTEKTVIDAVTKHQGHNAHSISLGLEMWGEGKDRMRVVTVYIDERREANVAPTGSGSDSLIPADDSSAYSEASGSQTVEWMTPICRCHERYTTHTQQVGRDEGEGESGVTCQPTLELMDWLLERRRADTVAVPAIESGDALAVPDEPAEWLSDDTQRHHGGGSTQLDKLWEAGLPSSQSWADHVEEADEDPSKGSVESLELPTCIPFVPQTVRNIHDPDTTTTTTALITV